MVPKRCGDFILNIIAIGIFGAVMGSSARAETESNGSYYAAPSWDQTLPSATRFIILINFNTEAVLDRNTGLVWERSPDALTRTTWSGARFACINKNVGGQKGWRLPSIPELASLLDPYQTYPALPLGHPFLGVQNGTYWSASTWPEETSLAWTVLLANGSVSSFVKTGQLHIWCVRGGMNSDQY